MILQEIQRTLSDKITVTKWTRGAWVQDTVTGCGGGGRGGPRYRVSLSLWILCPPLLGIGH